MRWSDVESSCPEFAKLIRERFETEQIFLLGTLRPDGSPRISGVECDFVGDDLMTGMIWRSAKALDLLRHDRMTIHSLVPDKANESDNQGDVKLYGRAVEVTAPGQRRRYEAAIQARIGWHPDEPYHCFAFDVTAAGMVRFVEGARQVRTWREGEPFQERNIPEFGPA